MSLSRLIRSTARLLLPCLLAATPFALANTIHVPADQPTIQAGINAASNGDTVLVAPGNYYENINFRGKAITVTSSGGAASTIIDGGNKGGTATVVFSGGETRASVISGFTIRGGGDTIFTGTGDGGVYVSGSAPTIQGNTIKANYCHDIDVEFGAAAILNNKVSSVLQNNQGAGSQQSYCTFGSGVHLQGAPSGISGLYSSIIGNTIENNLTGSGINLWAAPNVLIMNNTIRNNTSPDTGSAYIEANSLGVAIVENLIYGNTSTCGGAIANSNPVLIANNTIVDNVTPTLTSGSNCIPIAQIYPGGAYGYGESGPQTVVINNIISGSTSYPAVNCNWYSSPSEANQPTFENNILWNGGGPFFGSYCVDVSNKYKNIVADPQFVNPSAGDYHLMSSSPAIDVGLNSVVQTYLAMTGKSFSTDFDGNQRIQNFLGQGCVIDMGAYEYPGTQSACSTTETLQSSLNPSVFGQSVTFTSQLSAATGVPTGDVQFLDGSTVLSTQTISATGAASFTTAALAVGTHTITGNYQPSGTFSATTASLAQVVNGYPTTTALSCTPSQLILNQLFTLAVSVASPNGIPSGIVTVTDNGAPFNLIALLNGSGNLTTNSLAIGTHTFVGTYVPTAGGYAASSATCTATVSGKPTATTLTSSLNPANYGQSITLTAATTVSGASPGITGSVSFVDGTATLATVALDATGHAAYTTTALAPGIHTMTAVYGGNASLAGSTSAPLYETIVAPAITVALTSLHNPSLAFQLLPLTAQVTVPLAVAPTTTLAGNVTFVANGAPLGNVPLGTVALNAAGYATLSTALLPAGTFQLTASFSGTATYNGVAEPAVATSQNVVQTVLPAPTTIALTATPTTVPQGQTVALTATIAAPFSAQLPGGNIDFADTSAAPRNLGSAAIGANGVATLNTSALALGTHRIVATYAGSANFGPVASALVTVTVIQQDFAVAFNPPTLTLATFNRASAPFTLASLGAFADRMDLTCGNLPEAASCSFNNLPVGLTQNQSLNLAVEIDTEVHTVAGFARPVRRGIPPATWTVLLPFALLFQRRYRRMPLLAALLLSLAVLGGCTTIGYTPNHTPPGTYTILLTGTGRTTGKTHTAPLTLIVTP